MTDLGQSLLTSIKFIGLSLYKISLQRKTRLNEIVSEQLNNKYGIWSSLYVSYVCCGQTIQMCVLQVGRKTVLIKSQNTFFFFFLNNFIIEGSTVQFISILSIRIRVN